MTVKPSKHDDKFSPEETRKRMEAALRGARVAGHKPMTEVATKRKAKRRKRSAEKRLG